MRNKDLFLYYGLLAVLVTYICFFTKDHSQKKVGEISVNMINPNTGEGVTITGYVDEWEYYVYSLDSFAFAMQKVPRTFNPDNSQLYFVANWNTPSYFLDGEPDGISWDVNAFLGTKKGEAVYFFFEYKCYSEKFKKEVGDSIWMVEKMFPAFAVTTDPRRTCSWLASVAYPENFSNLDTFLMQATSIDDSKLQIYFCNLENQVLNSKGRTDWEKIINFTKQAIPGTPETWDAWKWPGYFSYDSDEKESEKERDRKSM